MRLLSVRTLAVCTLSLLSLTAIVATVDAQMPAAPVTNAQPVYPVAPVEERLSGDHDAGWFSLSPTSAPVLKQLSPDAGEQNDMASPQTTDRSNRSGRSHDTKAPHTGTVSILRSARRSAADAPASPGVRLSTPAVRVPLPSLSASGPAPPQASEPATSAPLSVDANATSDTSPAGDAIAPTDASPTEKITRLREKLETAELTEDILTKALAHADRAAELVRQTGELKAETARMQGEIDRAAATHDQLQTQMATPLTSTLPTDSTSLELPQLDQWKQENDNLLRAARETLDASEAAAKDRAERQPRMVAIIDQTRKELKAAEAALALPNDGTPLTDAQRLEQSVLVSLIRTQLARQQVEQRYYEALANVFPLQRDDAVRRKNQFEKQAKQIDKLIAEARDRESARQAEEARQQLAQAHPALRDLAELNATLTMQRKELARKSKQTTEDLSAINTKLEEVDAQFLDAKEKEERAGLTTAVGLLLRNQRHHLPTVEKYRRMEKQAAKEMTRLQVELITLEDQRAQLGDVAALTDETLAQMGDIDTSTGIDPRKTVYTLLSDRREYLDDLILDINRQLTNLAEVDIQSQKLADTVTQFRSHIDERVLWIPSSETLNVGTVSRMSEGIVSLAAPSLWVEPARKLAFDTLENPLYALLALGACLTFLWTRFRLAASIKRLGQSVTDGRLSLLIGMPAALLLTLVIASFWPGLVWVIGLRLESTALQPTSFSADLGNALMSTAFSFWLVEFFRQLCRPTGVGEQFLGWPGALLKHLHIRLIRLMAVGLPIIFFVQLTERYADGVWTDSLTRGGFILGTLILARVMYTMLAPRGVIIRELSEARSGKTSRRTVSILRIALVCIPLLLAGLSVAGYHYTAMQLLIRLKLTVVLGFSIVVLNSLIVQWFRAAHQQFARTHAAHHRHHPVEHDEKVAEAIAEEHDSHIDMTRLLDQLPRLTRAFALVLFLAGGWALWIEVLPAASVVSDHELWTTTQDVVNTIELADGTSKTSVSPVPRPVTIAHLVIAMIIIVLTIVVGRHLPGFLELAILRRLPLDHGGRHAVTTICRYAISLAGAVIAFQTIGIGWASVQWLVAALTVGLGFGMQEIFANFISGLILLLERPVRVGDTVTVDAVTGSVTNIRIRATTILDRDQKEYIVPNKEFVTGRILNWSLTDSINRVMIPCGIAYGADANHARELMVQVAEAHPHVLKEPEPFATFDSFGDSSLNLTLRCYLPDLNERLQTITDLHTEIHRVFGEANIEIPFPQMHLHGLPTAPAESVVTQDAQRRAA